MFSPSAPAPRIFVSHSHADNAFCRRLVADLRGAGADVWYDEQGLYVGAQWVRVIEQELQAREDFLVVLTPDAWASEWVQKEIALALAQHKRILGIIRKPTPVSGFLLTYQLLNATDKDDDATTRLAIEVLGLQAAQTSPVPTRTPPPPEPSLPPTSFPPRLRDLGFELRTRGSVEVVVPPLCAVPAGEFLMGSDPKKDAQADSREQPQHRVMLPVFQIARYPVTVAEYACFVRAGGREPERWEYSGKVVDWRVQQQRLDHPVVFVSWNDAVAYTAWLAKLTGEDWRLPTETEWEKAARGTDGRIYPWGDQWNRARANTDDGGPGTTTPVGTYPQGASPYGAWDMAGNVREWTSSLFKSYPYNSGDGRERADSTEFRALRGGSWAEDAGGARAAFRSYYRPGHHYPYVGFRVVRMVPRS